MHMTRGILFDCDGTLLDSRDAVLGFFEDLYSALGRPALDRGDPRIVELCMSRTDAEVLQELVPDEDERRLAEEWVARLADDYYLARLSPQPGALETLESLRPRYRLGICTNRQADMGLVVSRFGFDRYVDTIVTAEHVSRPKPHPEMLLRAADALRLPPAELVYVGDTGVDAEAAIRANIQFICYDPADARICGAPRLTRLRDLGALLRSRHAGHGSASPASG
jgi:phosphoglycolate phosphatase